MTDLTTQVQATDLQAIQDDDLVAVQGGGRKPDWSVLIPPMITGPLYRRVSG